jgi:hypothetical protein
VDTPAHYPTQYTPVPLGVGTPDVGAVYPSTPGDVAGDTPGPTSPEYVEVKGPTASREVEGRELGFGGDFYTWDRNTNKITEEIGGPEYIVIGQAWAPFDFGDGGDYDVGRSILASIEGKYGRGGKWMYSKPKKRKKRRADAKRKRESDHEEESEEEEIVSVPSREGLSSSPSLPRITMGGGCFALGVEPWNVENVDLNETFRNFGVLDMISRCCENQSVLPNGGCVKPVDVPMIVDVEMEEEGELEELDERLQMEVCHLAVDTKYPLMNIIEPLWRKTGGVRDLIYERFLEIVRDNICLTGGERERRVVRRCELDLESVFKGIEGPLTIQQHLELQEDNVAMYGNIQLKRKKKGGSGFVDALVLPDIICMHEGEQIQVNCNVLRFWDKLRLEPISGKKNAKWFVVYPDGELRKDVGRWGVEVGCIWEGCGFGKYKLGAMVPVKLVEGWDGERVDSRGIRSYARTMRQLGSWLKDIDDDFIVVYVVDVFGKRESSFVDLSYLCARTGVESGVDPRRLVFRVITIEEMSCDPMALKDIAFGIYDRCRVDMHGVSLYAPAYTLASNLTTPLYSFTSGTSRQDIMEPDRILHVAYSDGIACVSDGVGDVFSLLNYEVFEGLWKDVLGICGCGGGTLWRVVVVKTGLFGRGDVEGMYGLLIGVEWERVLKGFVGRGGLSVSVGCWNRESTMRFYDGGSSAGTPGTPRPSEEDVVVDLLTPDSYSVVNMSHGSSHVSCKRVSLGNGWIVDNGVLIELTIILHYEKPGERVSLFDWSKGSAIVRDVLKEYYAMMFLRGGFGVVDVDGGLEDRRVGLREPIHHGMVSRLRNVVIPKQKIY